jgi:hypothetical protein
MGNITWTDSVRNEEVLHSHEGQGCPIYNEKKANWTGHNVHRDCLLEHVIEGKIEGISDG